MRPTATLPRLALCAAWLGCATLPEDAVPTARSVVGGIDAVTCAWPTTVLAGDSCTGALVHPRLVVTAAHCVQGGITQVTFGETQRMPARTVRVASCTASPAYSGGETDDIGFCLLADAVTGVPLIPVMAACEASAIQPAGAVVEVGFGQNQVMSGANDGFGTKRTLAARVQSVTGRGQIDVTTGSQAGEYFGDSGGPLFFQMPDLTWRLIGIDCCGPVIRSGSTAARTSIYTSVPAHETWLEQTSGIDLTPCHDGDAWAAGSGCTALPTNPDQGGGTWSTMCAGEVVIAPQPTCGGGGGDGGGGDSADGASEASTSTNTSTSTSTTTPHASGDGCSCGVGRGQAPTTAIILLAVGLVLSRRRGR